MYVCMYFRLGPRNSVFQLSRFEAGENNVVYRMMMFAQLDGLQYVHTSLIQTAIQYS